MAPTSDIAWDPRSDEVLANQIKAYDALRGRCPVAHSDYMGWTLLKHKDIAAVLNDSTTYSSAVSTHLSVPNGMDPPLHTAYRALIEPYFGPERMALFEPRCRHIVRDVLDAFVAQQDFPIDVMAVVATPLALRLQCAFMGWPTSLHEPLGQWIRKNHEATLSGDRAAMAAVALEFDTYIKQILQQRRDALQSESGEDEAHDVTSLLMRERVNGQPLSDDEIVSIVRNWTVGELGTIAASIGILMHYLAVHDDVMQLLQSDSSSIAKANDEILRIHAPLISNRRVTTRAVSLGGQSIPKGERLTLLWASANRDEVVFGNPDEFRLDRNPSDNLLYGAGIHVCPGAPLARLELQVFMEELLARIKVLALSSGHPPSAARYPASGFASLYLHATVTCEDQVNPQLSETT